MARSSRGGRGSSRRGGREEVPEALEFAEPERPRRAAGGRARSSGGGGGGSFIGLVIPLLVTLVAALFLLLTGFFTANSAKGAMERVVDEVGVGTAIALASVPTDWWRDTHGTEDFWTLFEEKRAEAKQIAKKEDDSRLIEKVDIDFKKFLDETKLEPDPMTARRNEAIIKENRDRLSHLVGDGSPILFAEIGSAASTRIASSSSGQPNVQYATSGARDIAGVAVRNALIDGAPGRVYVAPAKDAFGAAGGEVRVYVSARAAAAAAKGLTGTYLLLAVLGILLVGGIAFGTCMVASKGVRSVTSDLEAVARGDLDVRITPRGGGEAASLARMADRAMKTFRAVQEQSITAAAVQPAAPIEASVDTSSLLPSEPLRIDGYEVEAVHKPCPAAANDYYDYFRVDDAHIGIVIADMPHAGAQGAFAAATFRALMRAYSVEETSPAAVLGRVNRVMANELKRGDHITAMYVVLDVDKGIVTVASAGHLPLIFWKFEKKGSALLNPEGIAIGLDKGPVFEKTVVDKRIKLDRGDRIVLYTDGPVAAESANGEEFGEQRFYYLVSREAPKNSAAFVNFVANEVDLFHEGAMQQDDITIVTLRKVSE